MSSLSAKPTAANRRGQRSLFELDDHTNCEAHVQVAKAVSRGSRKRKPAEKVDLEGGVMAWLVSRVESIEARITSMESVLNSLAETLRQEVVKEFYTTKEVAKKVGRQPYTVREWCRLGRVKGQKTHSGRGIDEEWRISHEELTRILNEGLLPVVKTTKVSRPRRIPR